MEMAVEHIDGCWRIAISWKPWKGSNIIAFFRKGVFFFFGGGVSREYGYWCIVLRGSCEIYLLLGIALEVVRIGYFSLFCCDWCTIIGIFNSFFFFLFFGFYFF